MWPPGEILLRSGERARVRHLQARDAAALRELLVVLHDAGVGMTMRSDELEQGEDFVEEFIAPFVKQQHPALVGTSFVIERGTQLIAEAQITREQPADLRHNAEVFIGVHPDYQRQGLGRMLLETLLAWVTEGPGTLAPPLERVEARVHADNAGSVSMVLSCGFEREAIRRAYFRDVEGFYVDEWVMVRWVNVPDGHPKSRSLSPGE